MKLPNEHLAQVSREKIVNYLLSPTHRDGKGKHGFFMRFGFTEASWEQLANALRQHATDHNIISQDQTAFGGRYVIEGRLRCPDGRRPVIRTVWFIDSGSDTPRLVTAYPLER